MATDPIQLPSANISHTAFLILGKDVSRWEETLQQWESSTLLHMGFVEISDSRQRAAYMENLLGPMEKKYFQSWRTQYPDQYERLIGLMEDPQKFTSQIRQLTLGQDYYRGQTQNQEKAMTNLDQLEIKDMKDFYEYALQYAKLATDTGRAHLDLEVSNKFFWKMPQPFGARMQELWEEANPTFLLVCYPG